MSMQLSPWLLTLRVGYEPASGTWMLARRGGNETTETVETDSVEDAAYVLAYYLRAAGSVMDWEAGAYVMRMFASALRDLPGNTLDTAFEAVCNSGPDGDLDAAQDRLPIPRYPSLHDVMSALLETRS